MSEPEAQIERQLKIDYSSIDPRALSTDVLRKLRIIPLGKRILLSTGRGDYIPVGFTAKKEDDHPEVEGEINLNGGYFIKEFGTPTKGKIGSYSTLVRIRLTGGERDHLDPNTLFLSDKPSIIKPTELINQILKERGEPIHPKTSPKGNR